MKFIDEDSTEEEFFFRKVSEDGKIEVGIAPVLYGFRIRAGYVNSGWYNLDYCAGADTRDIKAIYSIVLTVLSQFEERVDFGAFPQQIVKPMYNDHQCFIKLVAMLNGHELIPVDVKGIHERKAVHLKKIWSEMFNNLEKKNERNAPAG